MRWDDPVDDVFAGASSVRVLRALDGLPQGFGVSGRELARRAGLTHPTVMRVLRGLAETGLVTRTRSSSGYAYELNREHVLAEPVTHLLRTGSNAREDLVALLRQELMERTDKVRWAALFGSAAWGGSTPTSDVDLAVSCSSADVEEVERVLDDVAEIVRARFGNRLSPIVTTGRATPRTGVWSRVVEEGIPVIGSKSTVEA